MSWYQLGYRFPATSTPVGSAAAASKTVSTGAPVTTAPAVQNKPEEASKVDEQSTSGVKVVPKTTKPDEEGESDVLLLAMKSTFTFH